MKKKDFIQLTLDLYDLTGYFPNKEPLRYKIRGMANDILSDLILLISSSLEEKEKVRTRLLENIRLLENMFEVAEPQDWVSPDDIEGMKEEYDSIREAVSSVSVSKSEAEPELEEEVNKNIIEEKTTEEETISDRQQRIVEEIEGKGPSQISDLVEEFTEVSRRTLIRDLNELTDKGLVSKTGKGPAVFYSLNK